MKRKTLFYTSYIATASNNKSSLHFTIFTHTIACSHIFFSETRYCSILPYPSVVNMEKRRFTNFENSYKINKNSNNDNFFAVVIRGKRKFILPEKKIGFSDTLNSYWCFHIFVFVHNTGRKL